MTIWLVFILILLLAAWLIWHFVIQDGGFTVGWHNDTMMVAAECPVCDGYGMMYLQDNRNGTTSVVKIPYFLRTFIEGQEIKEYFPQIANLKDCDNCRGMGEVITQRGPDRIKRLSFPWPWRH